MVTTIFNFHNLQKWVACADRSACLKDQWAQQWDRHPSVFQAGTAILNKSNFVVTTVFNFHNLKKWVACTDCGACLKGRLQHLPERLMGATMGLAPIRLSCRCHNFEHVSFYGYYCI